MTRRERLNVRMQIAFGIALGLALSCAIVALNPATYADKHNGITALAGIGSTAIVLLLWPWLTETMKGDGVNGKV